MQTSKSDSSVVFTIFLISSEHWALCNSNGFPFNLLLTGSISSSNHLLILVLLPKFFHLKISLPNNFLLFSKIDAYFQLFALPLVYKIVNCHSLCFRHFCSASFPSNLQFFRQQLICATFFRTNTFLSNWTFYKIK